MIDPDVEGLHALEAMHALDALPADEQADAELRHGTFPLRFAGVTVALAEGVSDQPPDDLVDGVLARALSRRPAGRASAGTRRCSPLEAYTRTLDDLDALLAGLDDADWATPAHERHGTVQGLIAHLTGMERLCAAWVLGAPTADPRIEHVAATRATVAELADAADPEVHEAWRAAARRFAAVAAAADAEQRVVFHDITTTVDGLLTMRAFELWAHSTDIALAVGRPLPVLDAERMLTLSARLMHSVPMALAYRGAALPGVTARFVLTGESGGCYDVPLDPRTEPGRASVTIVADVVDLCRVAARRLSPAELGVTVEGDADVAAAVLAHLDAFARD